MKAIKRVVCDLVTKALGDRARVQITTRTADYMKDRILGMITDRYLRGPRAVNYAHDHGSLPIGRTVSLEQTDRGIVADFEWLKNDPQAALVRNAFEQNVLGASIEFFPEGEPTRNEFGGYDYVRPTLTGYALTGNPANPECVALTKALTLGRDADDEIVLTLTDDKPAADAITISPAALTAAVTAAFAPLVAQLRTITVSRPDPQAPTFDVDRDELRSVVRGALSAAVAKETRSAVNALRGRID